MTCMSAFMMVQGQWAGRVADGVRSWRTQALCSQMPARNLTRRVPPPLQVATRRVKQANKADIPLVDDHVSKIEHIGRETVKKLVDLQVGGLGGWGLDSLLLPAGLSGGAVMVCSRTCEAVCM